MTNLYQPHQADSVIHMTRFRYNLYIFIFFLLVKGLLLLSVCSDLCQTVRVSIDSLLISQIQLAGRERKRTALLE